MSTANLLGYDSALLCDINPLALVKSVKTAKQNGVHAIAGGRKDLESRMERGENIIVSNPPYFDIGAFDPTAQTPSGLASSIVRLGGFNLEFYKELDELLQSYAKVGYFTTSSVAEDALEFLTKRSECIAQTDFPLSNLKKAFKLSNYLSDDHTVKVWRYER